jgi:hypothetical protein
VARRVVRTTAAGVAQARSFVLRVWSRDGVVVQGQVTRIPTGQTVWFRTAERLLAFLLADQSPEGGERAG